MNNKSKTIKSAPNNYYYNIVSDLLSPAGIVINGDRPFDIQVKDVRFFKRVVHQSSLGLGESYMDGWWECERIDIFIDKILRAQLDNHYNFQLGIKNLFYGFFNIFFNRQSRRRAWVVGKEHYDIGNDLFTKMLDPYMQYSCGYWKIATNITDAQNDKLKLICEKLQLRPGLKLLDIGCGWGGLARYATENYGVSVYGITISAEQQALATDVCKGLDTVISLEDYRDLNYLGEKFDRIVSVGMFEHVGPKNYNQYFSIVNKLLKDDGLFLLHSIGSNKTDQNVDPWINKYIFPNGCLPSIQQISKECEGKFIIEDLHNFGPDYDKTLSAWYENFVHAWPVISNDYSEKFKRMFTYYLNSCAGAFRSRNIQLWQIILSKGISGGVRAPR